MSRHGRHGSDQLEEAELVALARMYVAAVKARLRFAPELWCDWDNGEGM